ncbi:hypothetical protein ACYU03_12110 [Pseudomonas sp. X10]
MFLVVVRPGQRHVGGHANDCDCAHGYLQDRRRPRQGGVINFHFRPPVLRDGIYQKKEIKRVFDSFDDSSHKDDEHWAVDIRNIDDAQLLIRTLNLR